MISSWWVRVVYSKQTGYKNLVGDCTYIRISTFAMIFDTSVRYFVNNTLHSIIGATVATLYRQLFFNKAKCRIPNYQYDWLGQNYAS
jgi:hypothetical protein